MCDDASGGNFFCSGRLPTTVGDVRFATNGGMSMLIICNDGSNTA